ncbi:NAD(P)/FAD-dependent oxidoreductase [Spirosoma endbachense]|uniref:FAD-dependent oxidoreductase n=1 Tax=Spirosoma endbachense TaxID=2666025 RepID=A0A6P1W3R0_9BACT|nr:NAD(P)/FAD-dependent oxidoreductase [Spirosoma endbachense]QHV99534.1 FAD-dependent oxidoreductase [Spirosoma endbachense]
MFKTDVVIIGGGLAGLVSALELAKAGHAVVLVERKSYPFHKVCGEYVSNEVKPYIQALGVNLESLGAATINHFQVSAPSGRSLCAPLDLGGFGISRYTLDHELYQLGKAAGVEFLLNQEVDSVLFNDSLFTVSVSDRLTGTSQILTSRLVIGAFGKRSKLDKTLDRSFLRQPAPASRSSYIGVKYHIKCDFPTDLIALHNFTDGYCGMSAIEDGNYCLCYLTTRSNLRLFGNIPDMERAVLYKNPHLKIVFENADFLYDKPEVINEISFASKQSVENHMLMVGDSAGLITPLCGNGMAMAIHGAKLASNLSAAFLSGQLNRSDMEQRYQRDWSKLFAQRLWVGRTVQQLFGTDWLSELAVRTLSAFKPALRGIMRQTHGAII